MLVPLRVSCLCVRALSDLTCRPSHLELHAWSRHCSAADVCRSVSGHFVPRGRRVRATRLDPSRARPLLRLLRICDRLFHQIRVCAQVICAEMHFGEPDFFANDKRERVSPSLKHGVPRLFFWSCRYRPALHSCSKLLYIGLSYQTLFQHLVVCLSTEAPSRSVRIEINIVYSN